MLWPPSLAAYVTSVSPVDSATGSFIGYVFNYGILGIVSLVGAWLFYRGWRLTSPAVDAATRATARDEARADLIRENEHLTAKLGQTEAQRDEAMKVAQTSLVPVLLQFTNTTSALIPLLQEVVRNQEGRSARNGRG